MVGHCSLERAISWGNFAKAFDVTYRDANNEQVHVWATSWGVSTRLIGALIMTTRMTLVWSAHQKSHPSKS